MKDSPAYLPEGMSIAPLEKAPPPEQWDDWVEFDARAWPRKVENHYVVVPTTCFNCEAACGLLAFVDKKDWSVRRMEGNPYHPASRGRNCAKGPATVNQIKDPERILYPLKRTGKRGEGKWQRVSWDQVLDEISSEVRRLILEGRRNEIMYHVGRPGHDGYMERVLQSWGIDGHNSHTNVCSSAARLGYDLWQGLDRPSPDHAHARFILMISSHLETGHYFNPHAQRIIEAKLGGAKIAVMDTRLSNTASMADYWLPTYPGTETAVLLAMARLLLFEGLIDKDFVRRWTNWRQFMSEEKGKRDANFEEFLACLREIYSEFTPAFAEQESGIPAQQIIEVAREIGRAGSAFATHVWRSAASGNLGGWQVSRALEFLNVLTGSVGTRGGTSPAGWDKFVPVPFAMPEGQDGWNELIWPREYPLAHHEMSYLLPYFLKEGRGRLGVYFTRVYNPVWTNPDGASWIEVLRDEDKVGMHAALTPIWSETAWLADYVLPMGVGGERHDLQSQETHAARWIAFRQPVVRVARERAGEKFQFTYLANPGEVWEEDEFWINLSWRIDPDGGMGIRRFFESPYHPGERVTVEEYYRWIFENSVPGLPESAAREGLSPLEYMRKYGAFEVKQEVYDLQNEPLEFEQFQRARVDELDRVLVERNGRTEPVGLLVDGKAVVGFPTPSRRLEFFSGTLKEWGWAEYALPGYIRSHVHWTSLDREKGEYVLISTFRLPTLIHTRSGNAKWLNEISHSNPLWMHPTDARRIGVTTGDLIKVNTAIGHFVLRTWVTEGIRPGVVACSHHMGRWRITEEDGTDRWCSALVKIEEEGNGIWRIRQTHGVRPFKSGDPDSERIWWQDAGVHQNLTFASQPDPVSGMHCWHQKVRLELPSSDETYGDILVDTNKSFAIYQQWIAMTRPAPGPGLLRRPLWFQRPFRPRDKAFYFDGAEQIPPRREDTKEH
jgi:anaerobic selenocysteine-containing dehydrogenase